MLYASPEILPLFFCSFAYIFWAVIWSTLLDGVQNDASGTINSEVLARVIYISKYLHGF